METIPTDALDAYLIRHPVRVDLSDLPRELIAIETVWNEGISIGEQDYDFYVWKSGSSFTVSKSANDSASSSSSVSCEVYLKYKDVATHNLFGERLFFYLPNNVTEADIIDKVNSILGLVDPATVDFWPVFRPESETLITTGQSVKVVANVQISLGATITDGSLTGQQWDKGTSDDYSANINASAVQIPPCIHGAIAIGGGTSRSRPVAVTAYMQMYNSQAGFVSATKTKTGTASASIYPTSLAPTSPSSIPTSGTYIMDMDVRKFKYGYSAVTVILFDASKLA